PRPRRRRDSRPRVVASMLTTAGLMRSTTSAKLIGAATAGELPARGEAGGGPAVLAGAPAETADRAMPPATIAPTRKATTAVSATVTKVKRRDISAFHYKRQELFLIQCFHAQFLRLLEFAAGVAPEDEVAGLL